MNNQNQPINTKIFCDIWKNAQQKFKNIQSQKLCQNTLIFIGQKSAGFLYSQGKTTFLKSLKPDTPIKQIRPTKAVTYNFIKNFKNQITNCYQIGGGKKFCNLISTFITRQNYEKVIVVLVVDLSKPHLLINTCLQWLQIIKNEEKKFFQNGLRRQQVFFLLKFNKYQTNKLIKLSTHPDKNIIQTLPTQIIIIGAKYDIFNKLQSKQKKWVIRALRFIAHVNGCSIFFTSSKDQNISNKTRTIFNKILYQKKNQKQQTLPLNITFMQDNIQEMNLQKFQTKGQCIQQLRKTLNTLFEYQDKGKQNQQETQVKWQLYKQPVIDQLVQSKLKQINLTINSKKK